MIDDVLASAEVDWQDLTAIGVGVGPGNFTGLRIAVASARGLSLSLGIPAIGVSAFEALAFGKSGKALLTVVDGRRDYVHVQMIAADGQSGDPETLSVEALAVRYAGQSMCVIGHRAEDIAHRFGPGASVGISLPIAQAVVLAATAKLGEPLNPPKPLYVRPADAAPSREAPPTLLP